MSSAVFKRHLPHSAQDLMAFVADVEGYPEFINVISALRIAGEREVTKDGEHFEAEMRVAYKFLSERVRCHVDVNNTAQTIVVRKSGNDGALRALVNDWTFHSLSDGTTLLDFKVDVTLKSASLNFLARQKFDDVAQKIMALFIKRAGHTCPKVRSKADLSAEIAALTT